MELLKGGRANGDSSVVLGDFSASEGSLFYARAFYELPIPGVLVQVSKEPRIVDVNRLALDEFALNPLKVIGARFCEVFDSPLSVPALITLTEDCSSRRQHMVLADFTLVTLGLDQKFEVFGVNSFDTKGEKYLILLFKSCADFSDDMTVRGAPILALTDPVTGLPNTVAAERKLEVYCSTIPRRSKDLVVALFSLEGWRKESNTCSPLMANELICAMVARLKPCIKDGVFISRYRSDEFLVVIQGVEDYRKILDFIQQALTSELVIRDFSFILSVNAGVYVREIWDSLLVEDLLAKARKAAERAKLKGGNRYIVYRDRMSQTVQSAGKAWEFVDAFRLGEFRLYFQPVMCFKTGKLDLAEGLLRWAHPQKGIQRPAEFLESIEELTVYGEVDLWVLDLALSTLEDWWSRGLEIKLCINIGALQLSDEVFLNRALSVISNYMPKVVKNLSIDVIKQGKVSDTTALIRPLKSLGKTGIRFSLDDFGTGDAKLLSMDDLPIDSIKIGQSYVTNLEDDLGSIFIIQNIVEFASQNGVSVYAKGVETSRQYNLLRALGCSGVQGYVISRPLSEPDFMDYLDGFAPKKLAEFESCKLEGPPREVFSFALAEHRALLKEMLIQTINRQAPREKQKQDLEAFFGSLSSIEKNGSDLPLKRVQFELVKRSLRRLIAEMSVGSEEDLTYGATDAREIVLMLSELIVSIQKIVD